MPNRKTVAGPFGGRSVEHEISVLTALQLIKVIDVQQYRVLPVYVAPDGHWYTGRSLLSKDFYRNLSAGLPSLSEVTLLPVPDIGGLSVLKRGRDDNFDSGSGNRGDCIPVDVYFLAFHGEYGEDGAIQGLLELADAAYTGCGVLGSAVAMNKYICKSVLHDHGIPVLPGTLVEKFAAIENLKRECQRVVTTPGLESYPLFVKPCHLGSSIGIAKVGDEASLASGLAGVFKHDSHALVEPFVSSMMEINVSVVDGEQPTASVVEVPVPSEEVLSYEDKYLREGGAKKGGEQAEGMANLTRNIDPQDLDGKIKQQVIEYALRAFKLLECSGIVRFDFIYDLDKQQLFFNELNSQPGSFSFYLWVESHPRMLYTELATQAIERALVLRAKRASLIKELEFRALRQ